MFTKNTFKISLCTCSVVLLMTVLPRLAHSQQREILDWKFFKNDRPSNGEWQAFTWYNINYRYKIIGFEGETVKLTFEVVSKMDTAKSYFETARRLKNDTYLLKHEQGHADIAYIYAVKLRKEYTKASFSKDTYRAAIKKIWDTIFAEMKAEQARYDDEVDHSKNRVEQERWNSYLEKTIATLQKG